LVHKYKGTDHKYAPKARGSALQQSTMLNAVLLRVLISCVFVSVVTELKTCHIYKAVLRIIKIAVHNLSGASNFTV
jgi:hypothetical protein